MNLKYANILFNERKKRIREGLIKYALQYDYESPDAVGLGEGLRAATYLGFPVASGIAGAAMKFHPRIRVPGVGEWVSPIPREEIERMLEKATKERWRDMRRAGLKAFGITGLISLLAYLYEQGKSKAK